MSGSNKLRLIDIYKILYQETDEDHPLSTNQLIQMLETKYGISAHRTTIAEDIQTLTDAGCDIVTINSTQNKYFMGERTFELPELKLLIDAVSSSKMLTQKKSDELVKKLSCLSSRHQSAALRRNLCTPNRIKPANENIYYIIDAINEAINRGRKLSFYYFAYGPDKSHILKNDGKPYILSPYTLLWNGDYYYVVGFSEKHQKITTFRVDRIESTPEILFETSMTKPKDFDIATFVTSVFQMYEADWHTVELRCQNEMMKLVIDRFGEEVKTRPCGSEEFIATVRVSAGPTFFGWVFGFGGKIKIISPKSVKEKYREMAEEALRSLE